MVAAAAVVTVAAVFLFPDQFPAYDFIEEWEVKKKNSSERVAHYIV